MAGAHKMPSMSSFRHHPEISKSPAVWGVSTLRLGPMVFMLMHVAIDCSADFSLLQPSNRTRTQDVRVMQRQSPVNRPGSYPQTSNELDSKRKSCPGGNLGEWLKACAGQF
jgi:hypothetical protein